MTATEHDAPAEAHRNHLVDTARGAEPSPGRGLPQLGKGLGVLLGSTTALSAILFYFGWSRAYYFYDYFGVESSLLGLSTRDYLQLSVDGLFVPLAIAAGATLAVLWCWSKLVEWTARHGRSALVTTGAAVAGVVLLLNGLSRIGGPTPLNAPLAIAPLCLGGGAVLLVAALRRHRSRTGAATPDGVAIAEWAVVLAFVGLGVFWAANDYSAAVGRSRAEQLVSQLPYFPRTTLYTEKRLGLTHPGVREVRCADPEKAYGFRYDGLALILQSGDQYLLLPTDWKPDNGLAVLLPRSASLRLEFAPAGSSAEPSPTC